MGLKALATPSRNSELYFSGIEALLDTGARSDWVLHPCIFHPPGHRAQRALDISQSHLCELQDFGWECRDIISSVCYLQDMRFRISVAFFTTIRRVSLKNTNITEHSKVERITEKQNRNLRTEYCWPRTTSLVPQANKVSPPFYLSALSWCFY